MLKPPALKGLKGELLKTARKTRVAAFTGQREKQIAQGRRVLHIGKKIDKLIKSITQPLEVGLDILDRVVLARDEQRVHILVVQVECAAVDVRARADVLDRDRGERFFADQLDHGIAQRGFGELYTTVDGLFGHGAASCRIGCLHFISIVF